MILLECVEEWERHINSFGHKVDVDKRIKPTHYPCIVVDKHYFDNRGYECVEIEFIYKEDFEGIQ